MNKLLINFSNRNKTSVNDSGSDFTTSFSSVKELNSIISVKVKSVVFTNTVYNINEKNNKFYYYDGVSDTSVTLAVGQYSVSELLSALESALAVAPVPIVADFSLNTKTYKIELVSSVPAIELYDSKGSIYNKLGVQLGLDGNSGLVASYVFPNIVDISGLDKLFICSKTLSQNPSVDNLINGSGETIFARMNVVKSIPVISSFGFKMNYNNESDEPDIQYERPRGLASIDIQLRDNAGDIVELNGAEVYIGLEVEFI